MRITARKRALLGGICLCLLGTAALVVRGIVHEKQQHGTLLRVYRDPQGQEWKYRVFIPFAYDYAGSDNYPTILNLHGWTWRGNDGYNMVAGGMPMSVNAMRREFPFITIYPQSVNGPWLAETADAKRAMAIVAEVQREFRADPKRLYLTGASSGGIGVWSNAVAYPNKWAAIVPVAWDYPPGELYKIKHIPCWYFASSNDEKVPVARSRKMVENLKLAGGNPKYTEYLGHFEGNHVIDEQVYGNKELYQWLLQQKLPDSP